MRKLQTKIGGSDCGGDNFAQQCPDDGRCSDRRDFEVNLESRLQSGRGIGGRSRWRKQVASSGILLPESTKELEHAPHPASLHNASEEAHAATVLGSLNANANAPDLLVTLVAHHKHRVVHVKRDPYDVYVGRASAGAPADADPNWSWGNPYSTNEAKFKEHLDLQTRTTKYLHWLLEDPAMVAKVRSELPGKVLSCWCAPGYCHGWLLAAVANCSAQDCELLCGMCANTGPSPFSGAVASICARAPNPKGKGKCRSSGKSRNGG